MKQPQTIADLHSAIDSIDWANPNALPVVMLAPRRGAPPLTLVMGDPDMLVPALHHLLGMAIHGQNNVPDDLRPIINPEAANKQN